MRRLSCSKALAIRSIHVFLFFVLVLPSPAQDNMMQRELAKNQVPSFRISPLPYYIRPGDTVNLQITSNEITTVSQFNITIYKVKDVEQFILKQNRYNEFLFVGKDSTNLLSLLEETGTYSRIFMPHRDSRSGTLSLNSFFRFIAREKGVYIIKVTHKNKYASCGFFVSGLSLITRFTKNSVLNYTSRRDSGEPVDSINYSVYFNGNLLTKQFSGASALNYILTEQDKEILYRSGYGMVPLIVAEKNGEYAVSDPYFTLYGVKDPCRGDIITNQPVYRPPAPVQFKISLREMTVNGYAVYANRDAIVKVTDPNGGNIFRKHAVTDQFGSYSDSVLIEAGSKEGSYMISAEIIVPGDTNDADREQQQTFTQSFKVEEYKKPEYKISLNTDKEQYSAGDKMKIDVQTDYYFGSPVPDAEVNYHIYKRPIHRPWWYYSEFNWFYRDFYGSSETESGFYGSTVIYTGKDKLDADGHLTINYDITEKFTENGKPSGVDYEYNVFVMVTDKSRRTISYSKKVNVTRSDYFINTHADRSVCLPGETIGLVVNTRDFSDKPVEAGYTVTVNRVIYEKKKRITSFYNTYSGRTSYLGDDLKYIKTGDEGYYEIEVTSFDSKNTKLTQNTGVYVTKGSMRGWWEEYSSAIRILPEKDSYFPGDTAVVYVELPQDEASVLVTGSNSAVVSYSVEKITRGAGYIKVPLTENHTPNFYMEVSYVKNSVYYTESRNIAVIPRSRFLNVAVSSPKTIYRPQEEGIINIAVTDYLGKPVKNSEVSIGIIDESIYAISPDNSPDIRSVFYPPVYNSSSVMYNDNRIYNGNNKAQFPGLLEMYNAAGFDYKLAFVKAQVFDLSGITFKSAAVLINGRYFAGYTNKEGKLDFSLPEGEYTVSLVYQNRILNGSLSAVLSSSNTNELKIKVTGQGIEYAELNKEFLPLKSTELKKGIGAVYGTVIDDKGESLIGARISLDGTDLRTGSDENGNFVLSGIPDGTYSLTCSYIGFNSQKMEGVIIKNGSHMNVVFSLSAGGVVLDTVSVIAKNYTIDNGSGKIIGSEFIDNTGIRGIENVVSKTSGVIVDEKPVFSSDKYATDFLDADRKEIPNSNDFVEAVTRSEFRDAILWMPAVYTDENGIAKVKVKFPDNLTTWRVTARVLTQKTETGSVTYPLTTRKDLIVRVETPRFFQQNDEVVISTIVHNYLNEEKTAKVKLNAGGLILVNDPSGEQVITLGSNEERRVDWLVKVNDPIGIAGIIASALTNEESDAMKQLVPVQPYGLKITEHSSLDVSGTNGVTKTFQIPVGTDLRAANMMLGLSPSLASSLLGSLDYLIGYPYGCIEQTMSRFMPTVVAANTLRETGAPEDPYFTNQIPKMVQKGLEKIYGLQRNDGGWGWWTHDSSDPYMSAYVLYGLKLAKDNGYLIDPAVLNSGKSYLRSAIPNKKLDNTSRAFVLFVFSELERNAEGFKIAEKQFTLLAKKETSSLAKALLSLAAGNFGRRGTQEKYISDVMRELTYIDDDKAKWNGKIKKYNWQNDEIITTALVLKALMADSLSLRDNRDIIEKGVSWLLSVKRGYAWGNTLQNAFIVYSLADYVKKYKELEPDYTLKVFVNDKPAMEKHITRDDIFRKEDRFIVTGDMLKTGDNVIRIEKSGLGKAYITTGVTYYQSDGSRSIKETYNGFDVEREYYELKKVYNKKQNNYSYEKTEFSGTVTSGSEIMVKVRVYPKELNNEYFMLEDPIPAGCEFLKEDWAYPINGENSYQNRTQNIWSWWYADRDIKDNCVVFFASNISQEVYEFSYLLRAQIPGTYNIMPSKGSLMYYPETNGSGPGQIMKIVDKK